MKLVILGATGATGRELVKQALERGHDVVALARDPARIAAPATATLRRVRADVHDPASLAAAIDEHSVVLSALGVSKGEGAGVLTAGAQALVALRPARVLWMGAYGTGPSAKAAGWLTRNLLKLMGARIADKVAADATVLRAGGVVFHAGPLSDAPVSGTRRTAALAQAPRRLFPASVGRATVAAAMLDEAERPRHGAAVVLPLER